MKGMFQKSIDKISADREVRINGGYNCIPFISFPRLSQYLPGIVKCSQTIITANSGIGKTQLTRRMYVLDPIEFLLSLKGNTDLDLTIHYLALEESAEEFSNSLIINRAFLKYGRVFTVDDLLSRHLDRYLSDADKKIIDDIAQELEEYYEPHIRLIDTVDNPYGLYKDLRDYSKNNGIHYYNKLDGSHGQIDHTEHDRLGDIDRKKWKYSHYTPTNPHKYEVVIGDHVSLLSGEKGGDTMQSIQSWSSDYSRKQITKHWKYASVLVQQQAADQEKQQFTNSGRSIETKLEPSLDGLGDNKKTQRDAHVVLGLFAPDRFEIPTHKTYNILKMKDHYRSLKILKNRYGPSHKRISLYYDGATNRFAELPDVITDYDEYLRRMRSNGN